MPKIAPDGRPLNNSGYVQVAASQTTANVSTPHDDVRGRDYLDRVIVTWATTAGTNNTVQVFDGSTSLALIGTTTLQELVKVVEFNLFAKTTAGFNVTSGASVSCIVVGRFGPGT